jgi:hypothetical protein
VLIALIPVMIAKGVLRLVRDKGVNFHAVPGGLALYLLGGLVFASLIAFIAYIESGVYSIHAPTSRMGRACTTRSPR